MLGSMTKLTDSEREQIERIVALIEADAGKVEVVHDSIVVTLPGTSFRVVYRKPKTEPGLVATEIVHDPRARSLAQQTEFLANAWQMANEKARQLGWIV